MIPDDATAVLIEIAGLEHRVWFRVRSDTLEVYAYGEARSALVVGFSLEDLCDTVRELLTDIIIEKIKNALDHSDSVPSRNPESGDVRTTSHG